MIIFFKYLSGGPIITTLDGELTLDGNGKTIDYDYFCEILKRVDEIHSHTGDYVTIANFFVENCYKGLPLTPGYNIRSCGFFWNIE